MGAWIFLAIHDTVCIVAGVYLVIEKHPWWALLVFFLAASTTIKNTKSGD